MKTTQLLSRTIISYCQNLKNPLASLGYNRNEHNKGCLVGLLGKIFRKMRLCFLFIILIFSGCKTSKLTNSETIGVKQSQIAYDNYFEYFSTRPGLQTKSIDHNYALRLIDSTLTANGLTVVPNVLFELPDGKIIPLNGYLTDHKVGYYFERTVSYPKKASFRTNPYAEYYKYDDNGKAYLQSFKNETNSVKVFKTNWYWYQIWVSVDQRNSNPNIELVSKEQALSFLGQDIENYFGEFMK